MPGATVLEGPLGAPDQKVPEIRAYHGASSKYAPISVPSVGDINEKIANVAPPDALPNAMSPDQFVLVLGDGLAVIPLNLSGTELRITLGAQHLQDLVQRVSRARDVRVGNPFDYLSSGCQELVIGYQILGRSTTAKSGEKYRDDVGPVSTPSKAPTGVFDGHFSPAFLEANDISSRLVPGDPRDWQEFLHGPFTFRCEMGDLGETWRQIAVRAPDGKLPANVPAHLVTGFWQKGRAYKRGDVVFVVDHATGQTKIFGAVCDIPAGAMSPVDAAAQQAQQAGQNPVLDGQVPHDGQQAGSQQPAAQAPVGQGAQAPAGP